MSKMIAPAIPLAILLQSAEKLIQHNEMDVAEALLEAIASRQTQYTFAHALLDTIRPQKKHNLIKSKYYVDMDYHTGLFEVLHIGNDERVGLFISREEAERYIRENG